MKHSFNPASPVIVVAPTCSGQDGEKAKITMALDTGATYTMIPWEVAEVLGYTPELSKERIEMVTASGVERAPLLTIRTIRFLNKKTENVKVVVHDLPPKSYVDGLLGLSFLRNFNITIDFRKGYVEIQ